MKYKCQINYINLSKSKPRQNGYRKKRITLKTFIGLLQHDINEINTNKIMKHLVKRRDVIITTANKGGAAVTMGTENYIKEVNCQLSHKNNYKILQTDPIL